MSITRRKFLAYAAGTIAVGSLPACATVPRYRSVVASGRLSIGRVEFAELAGDGDAVSLEADGLRDPILLVKDAEGTFHAISSRCTHQACRVRPGGEFLTCPCHGSTFAFDGEVLRGPAQEPLPTFAVEQSAATIDVLLEVPAT